jgi:hypothetical protein
MPNAPYENGWRTDQIDPPHPRSEQDVHLAIRALAVHWPEPWPQSVLCTNDHSLYPCQTRRWVDVIIQKSNLSEEEAVAAAAAYRSGWNNRHDTTDRSPEPSRRLPDAVFHQRAKGAVQEM